MLSRGRIVGPDLRHRGNDTTLTAAKRLRTLVTRAVSARITRDVVVVAERRAIARRGRNTWGKLRGSTPSPSRRVYTSSPNIANVRRNTHGTNTARLWAFANYSGPRRTGGLAFTRQRSLVRFQHRPFQESSVLRQNKQSGLETKVFLQPLLHKSWRRHPADHRVGGAGTPGTRLSSSVGGCQTSVSRQGHIVDGFSGLPFRGPLGEDDDVVPLIGAVRALGEDDPGV